MKEKVISIIKSYGRDPERLMDILLEVQSELRCVPEESVSLIASELGLSEAKVNETKSFYHFFTSEPVGKYAVYLNNSATSNMMGMAEVADEFEKQAGIKFGEKTPDGLISLDYTACIGMADQEPAALINWVVFTNLDREKVKKIVAQMREGKPADAMIPQYGDGNNANPLVKSMVQNNIGIEGEVCLGEYKPGEGLSKALSMDPAKVIDEVKNSNLRGRGGAGFPTGLKWYFCSLEKEKERYVFCNADEGEPGTFKDRVLLTERIQMVLEGMTIAGWAIGAKEGILYLRHEYKYLKEFIENTIKDLRDKNLLGENIQGKGFDFDIRLQMGAGAYVCGEESALIESAEGKRGEPRYRPPFPAQIGYRNKPTVVNNVETFCSAVKIMEKGSEWHKKIGTEESAGTKLLSISGDCKKPGVYEVKWGMTLDEMLKMVGAEDTQAVQVAGPSGTCVPPSQFNRRIAIEDLPTGGSMIVVGKNRDVIRDIVLNFMEFFEEESCGSCITCRSINMILKKFVNKVVEGSAIKKDLESMKQWGKVMTNTSRCGLGQSSANPVLTTLANFPQLYDEKVSDAEFQSDFDMEKAIVESCEAVGRPPHVHE